MELPKLEFGIDYGGFCFWVHGGGMEYDELPLSEDLICELRVLCDEYETLLDLDDPHREDVWTKEHEEDYKRRARLAGIKLQEELRGKYMVINRYEEEDFL